MDEASPNRYRGWLDRENHPTHVRPAAGDNALVIDAKHTTLQSNLLAALSVILLAATVLGGCSVRVPKVGTDVVCVCDFCAIHIFHVSVCNAGA